MCHFCPGHTTSLNGPEAIGGTGSRDGKGDLALHMERRLTVADEQGFELLDAVLDDPFAICEIITDEAGKPVNYRFLRVSQCFEDITGFRGVEGRTVCEIVPGVEPQWIEHYGRVALDRLPSRFSQSSATTGRSYEVRAAPMDPPGRFVMTFRDVTDLQQVQAEQAALLDHAQHLLRELSHRVMNSFAGISAILAMEARAAPKESRAPLDRVQGRVQALAALYRRLDTASQPERIEVADYLGGLVTSIREAHAAVPGVSIETEIAPLSLPTRSAVPLALVVNELLTNALKHAFEGRQTGQVRVTLSAEGDLCTLCVADDGTGIAPAVGSGVGHGLVSAFVGELGGELSTQSGPDGTTVTVSFRT